MFTRITYLKDAVSYVEANGRLDIYNAPDYLDEVKEHLRNRYTKELILEFSKISFVASIGLRTILELHKIMQGKNGTLKLKNVSKEVMQSFEITGFDKFLTIENDSENSKEKELSELNIPLKYDAAEKVENVRKQLENNISDNIVKDIVKAELSSIVYGLNKWHDQVANILGCNSLGGSIELHIIQTLLKDDKGFNETLDMYEKISKNEYINEWTHQQIPFNKEIQQLFENLIPKLQDIRTRIKKN